MCTYKSLSCCGAIRREKDREKGEKVRRVEERGDREKEKEEEKDLEKEKKKEKE